MDRWVHTIGYNLSPDPEEFLCYSNTISVGMLCVCCNILCDHENNKKAVFVFEIQNISTHNTLFLTHQHVNTK